MFLDERAFDLKIQGGGIAVSVVIQSVNRSFQKGEQVTQALRNVNLTINKGEFITVIGPSGCGKSTLLKMIAGLDMDYEGRIEINGKYIAGPSIKQGMIFQEHRLFPWLNVEQNIAADLSLKDSNVRRRVDELIDIVRLKGFEKAYPRELSGGMSQRVAIARALLRNPEVLLLDEPFGALDAFTRTHLQDVLLDIWKKEKTTMIFVTHDLDESIYLGTKIVIMSARPGEISRGVPVEISHPRKKTEPPFQQIRQQVLKEFEEAGEH
ncbi:ABC transporter ATP-binding protein [Priestia megaterium]|uniref:ABC transporter ATP-binding protein n=1 Tax=Priestia megaterium TaxID=1404 RepID=UPI002452C71C|nr:ABC transporter ATP-binding protein [Priestia megaterium]MDH3140242.1 ABC transporter ATP-binding protein [Priestia megaterium]MED4240292.1 ABC transporter ATP-binding protein [Priestia megaterium]MED4251540.1 ABC transporter ATP-binding protein [Priestia megaterium]MED4264221.1 ABC transporter ATP-binding protein [Priestia megaterium]MED4278077.1 ABC transporter ATP-binding protein [Priestia megaterium]